jgi:hypothetical protein
MRIPLAVFIDNQAITENEKKVKCVIFTQLTPIYTLFLNYPIGFLD